MKYALTEYYEYWIFHCFKFINFSHKILIKFEMKIKFPLKNNFSIFLLLCLYLLEGEYLDLLLVIPIEFKLYSLHKGSTIMY